MDYYLVAAIQEKENEISQQCVVLQWFPWISWWQLGQGGMPDKRAQQLLGMRDGCGSCEHPTQLTRFKIARFWLWRNETWIGRIQRRCITGSLKLFISDFSSNLGIQKGIEGVNKRKIRWNSGGNVRWLVLRPEQTSRPHSSDFRWYYERLWPDEPFRS